MTQQQSTNGNRRAKKTAAAQKKTTAPATAPPVTPQALAAVSAAIMPAEPDNVTAVSLDLDTLEREGTPGPFAFRHGGRVYPMTDPMEVDWREMVQALSNPFQFLRSTMSEEDREVFLNTPTPAWKMNAIVDAYLKHHGLPTVGELAALPR